MLPKPAEAFEVDDGDFSSTQQMAGDGAGSSKTGKQQRRGGSGGSKQTGRGGKATVAMPAVEEQDEEGSWQGEEPGTTRQQQCKPATGAFVTDTQAVGTPAGCAYELRVTAIAPSALATCETPQNRLQGDCSDKLSLCSPSATLLLTHVSPGRSPTS